MSTVIATLLYRSGVVWPMNIVTFLTSINGELHGMGWLCKGQVKKDVTKKIRRCLNIAKNGNRRGKNKNIGKDYEAKNQS
jgi:hypothetical protein